MKPSDAVKVHARIKTLWPPRLVDPFDQEAARAVASALPPDVTVEHALVVVDEFFRRGSPFPPSWPEIAKRWTERTTGSGDDPDVTANAWLAEVYAEVGQGGGCFYRPMPEFSDPIIGAAVLQASGSWKDWGLTPNGGAAAEGEAFPKNLIPERDERFRRAVKALLRHRATTGERLPEIVGGPTRLALPPALEDDDEFVRRWVAQRPELPEGSPFKVPDLAMGRDGVVASPEEVDDATADD
jgi:hypothetical protein